MIDLIKDLLHAALHDKDRATLWLRGALGWAGTMLGQVLATSEDWTAWTFKQWSTKIIAATFVGSMGLVRFGEKNPKGDPNANQPKV